MEGWAMKVVGLDPSLTSFGYAVVEDDTNGPSGALRPKMKGTHRLEFIRDTIMALLARQEPDLVVYEGYAMGSRVGNLFHIGELGGVMRLALYEAGHKVLLVPPTSLKLFVTGNGSAKGKDIIMRTLEKQHGCKFRTSDEADAYGLAILGLSWADPRRRPRNRSHFVHRALRGCEMQQ